MKKRIKLTKNALFVISILVLIIVIALVLIFGKNPIVNNQDDKEKEPLVLDSLVLENVVIDVELLDFVSETNYEPGYQERSIVVDKDTDINGYQITNKQTFTKILELLPPGEDSPLLNNTSQKPSHEAYVLVLTGDVAKYKQGKKDVYKIVNASIEVDKQAVFVESDYNSVYIASLDGKKEKMVKYDEYKEAINNKDTYMTMLQW